MSSKHLYYLVQFTRKRSFTFWRKIMQITITLRGKSVQCSPAELADKAKELKLEAAGFARNMRLVKQAVREGRTGRINSADGYQISYQN